LTETEAPRIWGAIVGDPSMLKTPIIRAATAPIDTLEVEARKQHAEDMRRYEADMKRWKYEGSESGSKPRRPRQPRYLVEGTTIEALSEVLRDDEEATLYAPASKVLSRQDEMAEWVASFDRYRAGGRGAVIVAPICACITAAATTSIARIVAASPSPTGPPASRGNPARPDPADCQRRRG
jgi:hypothetical protein